MGRGAGSMTSRSRRSNGCGGSIISGCWNRWAMFRRQSLKRSFTADLRLTSRRPHSRNELSAKTGAIQSG